jgi:hypothetical protein
MPNIIYVLTNLAMPGLVKIGHTKGETVESRVAQLSRDSGVPLPFECHFAAEVEDCDQLERKLHELFSESRINSRREFFRVDPEKVVLAVSIGKFKDVTPRNPDIEVPKEEQEALKRDKERRPPINLYALNIKPGDTLTFSRDDNITAAVTERGKVIFRGETVSLSDAAAAALGDVSRSVSGSLYWKFEGELLDERRRRMEAQAFEDRPLAAAASAI